MTDPLSTQLRHPADPQPVPASKAQAVHALGWLAVLTGPLLGGVVPATVALLLARQFRRQAHQAEGFLTGLGQLRRGEQLAWAGLALAAVAVAGMLVVGFFQLAGRPPGVDYPPSFD
jgi:hydroxylaminobenzene mutase